MILLRLFWLIQANSKVNVVGTRPHTPPNSFVMPQNEYAEKGTHTSVPLTRIPATMGKRVNDSKNWQLFTNEVSRHNRIFWGAEDEENITLNIKRHRVGIMPVSGVFCWGIGPFWGGMTNRGEGSVQEDSASKTPWVWHWQWVFPQENHWKNKITGEEGRHHIHETILQRSVREAVTREGVAQRVGCHTFRHCLPPTCWKRVTTSEPFRNYWDIRMSVLPWFTRTSSTRAKRVWKAQWMVYEAVYTLCIYRWINRVIDINMSRYKEKNIH